jgi:ribosomal protein S18 acetylase RimI-like enzyme
MTAVLFRDARPEDAEALTALIKALAVYDGNGADVHFSSDQLRAALSGPAPRLLAILALDGAKAIGFVTYTIDYAIWVASDVLRIDDLFFSADYRGRGLGKRLMAEIARRAIAGNMVARWEVMPQNLKAQAFYRSLGAELRDKIVARWDGKAMAALLARSEERRDS